MAKKRGYSLRSIKGSKEINKSPKDEKKKDSRKSLPKGSTSKKGRRKEKDKRADRRQPKNVKRSKLGELQKKYQKSVGLKRKKTQSKIPVLIKGRIRDFRGRFIESHYQERLKRLKKELIRDGVIINGKKVTRFTSYGFITKAIYENKLFTLAETHTVSYFDVLGKIVTEVNSLKEKQEIFVKIKPFFRDFRVFNIKHRKIDEEVKRSTYFSQAVYLNPQLVTTVEHQSDLIQRVIDEFPRKIVSPLFRIKEKRFENPLTGSTYALEYDYNDIVPSGMDLGEFFDFLKAIMGDEYKRIAILRMRANLGSFGDEE